MATSKNVSDIIRSGLLTLVFEGNSRGREKRGGKMADIKFRMSYEGMKAET